MNRGGEKSSRSQCCSSRSESHSWSQKCRKLSIELPITQSGVCYKSLGFKHILRSQGLATKRLGFNYRLRSQGFATKGWDRLRRQGWVTKGWNCAKKSTIYAPKRKVFHDQIPDFLHVCLVKMRSDGGKTARHVPLTGFHVSLRDHAATTANLFTGVYILPGFFFVSPSTF